MVSRIIYILIGLGLCLQTAYALEPPIICSPSFAKLFENRTVEGFNGPQCRDTSEEEVAVVALYTLTQSSACGGTIAEGGLYRILGKDIIVIDGCTYRLCPGMKDQFYLE